MSTSEEARARGNELYKAGNINGAITEYLEASQLAQDAYAPLANLAAAYYEAGQYKLSNEYANKALANAATDSSQVSQASKDRVLVRRVKACLLHGDIVGARAARAACADSSTSDLAAIDRYLESSSDTTKLHGTQHNVMALPALKPVIKPTSTYEVIGIDPPTSLFDSSLLNVSVSDLSLLFVDASDLRNVLATVSRFADPAIKKPADLRLRLTIAETRTHVLARQLLIFSLLEEVASSADASTVANTLETLVYMFVSAIMPQQCAAQLSEHITKVMAFIKTGDGMTIALQASPADRKRLLNILTFWKDEGASYIVTRDVRIAAGQSSANDGVSTILHLLPARMKREASMYKETGVLLSDDTTHSNEDAISQSLARLSLSLEPSAADLDKIDSSWKPNVSLLGPVWDDGSNEDLYTVRFEHSPFDLGSQVTETEITAQQGLFSILSKWFSKLVKAFAAVKDNLRIHIVQADITQLMLSSRDGRLNSLPQVFDRIHLAAYPDVAGGSLWTYTVAGSVLRQKPECYITWKCLTKKAGFKSWKHYDREYLMLASEKGAEHRQDVQAIFGIRVDKDTYSEDEGSIRFESFGVVGYCRARRVGKPRIDFGDLVSRETLTTWLQRVCMKIVLPPPTSAGDTAGVVSPLSQHFFLLLVHFLHSRGYPAHWLSDVLQDLWSGTILTAARPPRSKPLKSKELLAHYTQSTQDLALAQEELRALVSLWSQTLGFIFVPHGLAPPRDVQLWRVQFDKTNAIRTPATYTLVLKQKDSKMPFDEKGWLKDRGGVSLVTAFEWDRYTHTAHFAMSKAALESFDRTQHVIEVWDSESWTCLSDSRSVSECDHAAKHD